MGWDGMGWDGMGWDGMGWDGMGAHDSTGRLAGISTLSAALVLSQKKRWVTSIPALCCRLLTKLCAAKGIQLWGSCLILL